MKNHVVIVTGSTRGIGLSIAKKLVQQGASVVINGRNEADVQKVVKQLSPSEGKIIGMAGSVEQPQTGEHLVKLAVDTFGKVTSIINNAGIIRDQFAYKMSNEDFSIVIDVHAKGAFYCTKPFIQQIKKQQTGGHIINITSDSGLVGNIGQLNYSAAKAAINGMTYTLAKELKRDNIIVNAIAPAALTDMTRPYVEKARAKAKEKGEPLSPMWDIGSPEDVAEFVTTLLKEHDIDQSGRIYGVNGKKIKMWKPPYSIPLNKSLR